MPESILIITPVGGDDQREHSDVTHCAIWINRAGFAALKSRLAAYDASREPMDAYKALLYAPDGTSITFFNLCDFAERAAGNEAFRGLAGSLNLDSNDAHIRQDKEADLLSELCDLCTLEWSIDLTAISVVAAPDFYATGIYDAGGMVNSRRLNLDEIAKNFTEN